MYLVFFEQTAQAIGFRSELLIIQWWIPMTHKSLESHLHWGHMRQDG
jgi:hypothetical protein